MQCIWVFGKAPYSCSRTSISLSLTFLLSFFIIFITVEDQWKKILSSSIKKLIINVINCTIQTTNEILNILQNYIPLNVDNDDSDCDSTILSSFESKRIHDSMKSLNDKRPTTTTTWTTSIQITEPEEIIFNFNIFTFLYFFVNTLIRCFVFFLRK